MVEQAVTQLQAQMEQMRLESGNMQRQFQSTVDGLRNEAAVAAARLEESRATIIALQSKSSSGTMEPKGLQKPKDFSNSEANWSEFSFRYENWMMGFQSHVKPYLRWAESQTNPITSYSDSGIALLSAADVVELSKQVYITLAQLLTEESHTILRNGADDNGLDAWRRLVKRWDPKTVGRHRNAYLRIAQPGKAKTVEQASGMLERWETEILEYQKKSTKIVDEDLKCAVIVEMMPQTLQTHLQMNARTLTTYDLLKQEVLMYLESRASKDHAPMDI